MGGRMGVGRVGGWWDGLVVDWQHKKCNLVVTVWLTTTLAASNEPPRAAFN